MNDLDTEDTFVWTDGRPVTNFQWRDQQPNGGTAQNCVTYDENTQWQDKDCDNVYYFICELSTCEYRVRVVSVHRPTRHRPRALKFRGRQNLNNFFFIYEKSYWPRGAKYKCASLYREKCFI